MSITFSNDNIQSILKNINVLSNTIYDDINMISNNVLKYTNMVQNKEISLEEYKDLLNDLQINEIITSDMSKQNAKNTLYSLVNSLISIIPSFTIV